MKKLEIKEDARIAIIAPHPDDECIGVSSVLIKYPNQTDIYVLTDGCFGSKETPPEDEKVIRRNQFEAEMKLVKPSNYYWMGYTDNSLFQQSNYYDAYDFSKYDIIFIPWERCLHPDHISAAKEFLKYAGKNKLKAKIYSYEVHAPFSRPSHYYDITDSFEKKMKLFGCHKDQIESYRYDHVFESLNRLRANQLNIADGYCECFLYIDPREYLGKDFPNDYLVKLYTLNRTRGNELFTKLTDKGFKFHRVRSFDIGKVYDFIKNDFSASWADEALPALINGDCFVAVFNREPVGFTCINATAPGFMGPAGVKTEYRRQGIYTVLAYLSFDGMYSAGHKYAICGMLNRNVIPSLQSIAEVMEIPNSLGSYNDAI